MMRILIFILALMSAFFVSAFEPHTYQDTDYVPAESKMEVKHYCYNNGSFLGEMTKDACLDLAISEKPSSEYYGWSEYDLGNGLTAWEAFCDCGFGGKTINYVSYHRFQAEQVISDEMQCPPDANPDYKIGPVHKPNEDTSQPPSWCLPLAPDCGAGYHSKKVSAQLGSTSCVPKECPPVGSGENLSSSPLTGGVPFNGGGMYCNDGCAYTVNADQISSSKYAVGTSQGVACGDKPYDNKKLANEGEEGQCNTSSNGEVSVLSCPNEPPPAPDDPDLNNDESKVDESANPEKPKLSCADGDTSCNLKNVETEIENSINRQIDNDNELHNKKIDADTKNAKAFLNVMESIDTAILLQTSQDERLHAVTVGKFNELIDAVNGIETGGGGGGGNGTGNGNIGGQDCEGTIEECAGIGSGDGVELPQETRNLEQYAQKYNNWLPNAELPPEKCITLTNGKTLCFSFEYFILFFQAISGLIVISSLIHSASIIVRSV